MLRKLDDFLAHLEIWRLGVNIGGPWLFGKSAVKVQSRNWRMSASAPNQLGVEIGRKQAGQTTHTDSGAKIDSTEDFDGEILVDFANDLGCTIRRQVCFLQAVPRSAHQDPCTDMLAHHCSHGGRS